MNCDVTRIKICGITNLEDALAAVEAGADLLGFIFYEPSPRYVRPEVAQEIVAGCRLQVTGYRLQGSSDGESYQPSTFNLQPQSSVTFVGVFVNSPLETVAYLLNFCQLDAAQLHGEEPPEFVNHFQGQAFKAFRPQSAEEAEALIQEYLPTSSSPRLPLSSPPPYPLLLTSF